MTTHCRYQAIKTSSYQGQKVAEVIDKMFEVIVMAMALLACFADTYPQESLEEPLLGDNRAGDSCKDISSEFYCKMVVKGNGYCQDKENFGQYCAKTCGNC